MSKHDDSWNPAIIPKDPFTRIFRDMVVSYRVSHITLMRLLGRYIEELPPSVSKSRRNNLRTNIIKGLIKETMTMDMFSKSLRILQCDCFEIYLVAHRGNVRTLHHVMVDFDDEIGNLMDLTIDPTCIVDPGTDVTEAIMASDPECVNISTSDSEVRFTLSPSSIRTRVRKPTVRQETTDFFRNYPDPTSTDHEPF